MGIFTIYSLFAAGIALIAIGISLAIIKGKPVWHVMTGIGAGAIITSVILAAVMLVSTVQSEEINTLPSTDNLTWNEFEEGYEEGYEQGYIDAYTEIFGEDFPGEYNRENDIQDKTKENNTQNPDDDYFIGDFLSDMLEKELNILDPNFNDQTD